jgi:hypothetical protein
MRLTSITVGGRHIDSGPRWSMGTYTGAGY